MANLTILIIGGLLFFLFNLFEVYFVERHNWNKGIDRKTGEEWEYFDTDSQGGRGYKSSLRRIWITAPGIERKK